MVPVYINPLVRASRQIRGGERQYDPPLIWNFEVSIKLFCLFVETESQKCLHCQLSKDKHVVLSHHDHFPNGPTPSNTPAETAPGVLPLFLHPVFFGNEGDAFHRQWPEKKKEKSNLTHFWSISDDIIGQRTYQLDFSFIYLFTLAANSFLALLNSSTAP